MDIIKIEENAQGIKTVNARDLFNFLESKQEFSNWIKDRIEKYGFTDGVDFTTILSKSTGGRPLKEYHLTIDMAKQMSMVENNLKGNQARRYFIEVEKRYLNTKQMTDDEIVLQALTIQTAKVKRLEIENMQMKPKAESFDKFLSAVNSQPVGDVAKMLNIGRNKLFAMLRNDKIIDQNNMPYQSHMKYFEVIDKPVKIGNEIKNIPVTMVKPDGIDYLAKKYS